MALREVLASFGIQFDKEGNLDKADKQVDGLTEKLIGLGKTLAGAFAVKEIVAFGHELLQEADALAKQSQALGVSAAELQGWQHAAALSGSSADEFSAAFTKFTRNVNEASEAAAGPAAKAFKDLGVDIKNGSDQLGAPIDLLDGVVKGLEGIQDPAKRTALVMDLFGKSGAKLLPLFSEGEEGLRKLRAEVQELGFGFDEAFLENAQEVNDNLDRLKMGLKGVGIQVLSEVLPGITEFSKGAVEVAKKIIGWLKGTKLVQAGLTALAAKGVSMVARAIPALIAKVGGLSKALASLRSFALRTILPFLLLEDAIVFLAGGKSAIGKGLDKVFGDGTAEAARTAILKWFNDVKAVVVNDVLPALKSITDSPLFQGVAKGALDGLLVVLQAMGVLLTDNADAAERLAKSLQKLGLGPSEEEAQAALEAGRPENRKPQTKGEAFTRKIVTSIFGDPLEDGAVVANEARNRAALEKQRRAASGIVEAPSAPLSDAEVRDAFRPAAIGPPPAPDYAAAFRPTIASLPVGAPAATVDNSTKTIAPVTTVNVTVQGDGAETGNRVGKAVAKIVAPINMRAIKDGLVPTPG